jgi:multidrug efflux system outer membrane protein
MNANGNKANNMRNYHLFLGLVSVAVLVGSCKVGPNLEEIKPNDFKAFENTATAVDSTSIVRWWDVLDDPVADSLVAKALRNNKDALVALAKIEEARAALGYTKADVWPRFSYSGKIMSQEFGFFNGQPNEFAIASLGMNWEIDFWGKFRRANEAAREELLATTYGARSVQVTLIAEVLTQYIALLDFSWRLEISRSTLASRDSGLFIIQARFDRGIIPEIDLNQAQIQRAIAAAAVPFYERKVIETQNSMKVLLGENPGAIQVGQSLENQDVKIPIPVGLPSTLLQRRPDVIQAERAVYAQNARVGVAVAQRFPSFSLTGMLGLASNDLSTFVGGPAWSVGADLVGPLFYFNKNKRRVEVEKARTQQALLTYENTVLKAFAEVENALVGVRTYEQEMAARLDNVRAANNALYLSMQRYDKGVTNYLEVLEQQRAAFDAELNYSQARQQYLNSFIVLYRALGGGWITPQEEQAAAKSAP